MTSNSHAIIVLILLAYGLPIGSAQAVEKTSLMLLPGDIKRGASVGTQGVTGDESGSLHYPDQIMAYPVRQTDENRDLMTSWAGTHKFFIVPLNIGVAAAKDKIPESLSLTVTFPGVGLLSKQPIVIDEFPKTGFSAAPFSGNASLKLNGDLRFVPSSVGSVEMGADAALSYKYAPNYANVVSGFGSGSAFWLFTRTQENYPVGELPLKLVVAVPIAMVASGMSLLADVKITYSGSWWTTGTSVGSFRAQISYPPQN